MLLKRLTHILLGILCFLLLNLICSFYLTPIEGILIAPTGLYRDANWQQPQLLSMPLLEGIKVNVLDIKDEGKWLKIETPTGVVGYIPSSSIRII